MAFPEVPRVIYAVNPLELVLCEFRFPPILRIEAEVPSQFQERIRDTFPFYEPKSVLDLSAGLPPEVASALSHGLQMAGMPKSHDFIDRSRNWTVTLVRDKLTLSCRQYERWEHFRERLIAPLAALREIYKPPFYVRIGLRYRDVINRGALGLGEVAWKELLRPWIAGPYGSADVESDIERTAHQLLIQLPGTSARVLVNHGLVQNIPNSTWLYAIDSDFYEDGPTEHSDVNARLELFHQQAGRLFRWCITERLHSAMRPEPISNS